MTNISVFKNLINNIPSNIIAEEMEAQKKDPPKPGTQKNSGYNIPIKECGDTGVLEKPSEKPKKDVTVDQAMKLAAFWAAAKKKYDDTEDSKKYK